MGNIEQKFQSALIKELRKMFKGCVILENDPAHLQGIPDLVILFGNMWAALECKASPTAQRQPNQEYYVALLNTMSYAAFVFPENKDDILRGLQLAFRAGRTSRVSEPVKLSLDKLRSRETRPGLQKLTSRQARRRATRVRP